MRACSVRRVAVAVSAIIRASDSRHDDGAYGATFAQRNEGVVDAVEREPVRDELGQADATLTDELTVPVSMSADTVID
jgi:hypothetical protein